jgi:DNA phosphorothioation-dependent restriction protein DptH
MAAVTTINTYYKSIIDLVLELHDNELLSAKPGHCMKITGLGSNELEYLWETVKVKYPKMDNYIISEDTISDMYISATKLIELRNKQENPLLVLIPSNSRTAAEDSYGNATFKEISLEGIEVKLKEKLISEIPEDFKGILKDEILFYLQSEKINSSNIIDYLIALKENGYTRENVGDYIFHLNLIPDKNLLLEDDKIRSRLNFNILSAGLLSSFNKPLYDRIGELPLEPNSLQKDVVEFIKKEKKAKSSGELCEIIFNDYLNLNFSNWEIPDLKKNTDLRLECEYITNGDKKTLFKQEEDVYILNAKTNQNSKLKVRITSNTPPKDIPELHAFRIILMAVNGGSGDVLQDLRLAKNSTSNRPYRDLTFDISTNSIEEGS